MQEKHSKIKVKTKAYYYRHHFPDTDKLNENGSVTGCGAGGRVSQQQWENSVGREGGNQRGKGIYI